ncbi:probable RNA-directed DNA polymerase from transposon X-element [Trichonephila clavipes]|nr:probable RNA-directed DNA polymerase from transposon X-element [Trichonephila clavipes]
MEPSNNSPSVEHRKIDFFDSFRYFIVKTPDTFSNVSPFLIEKAFNSSIGEVKSIRKMRSGDLFLEASSAKQATALMKLRKLAHLDVSVAPHSTLNFSRGVISPADFLNVSTEEIKENMQAQNVCDLKWPTSDAQSDHTSRIRCDAFSARDLDIQKTVCRGQPTCSRCAEVGHDSADCKAKERCVNCKGDHSSFSRSCPTWLLEKEITALKIKNKISYPEARRVVSSRTPVSGKSYASAISKSYVSTAIQVDASTAPTSATAASITPKNVAVDTLKSVSPPRDVKKNRKTRIKESGRRESDGRSVAQTFVFWLLARSKCEAFMTSFISWNCRGLRTRLADLKSIISTYQPACVALQETFLKSTMTMQVRGYNCVRRDVDGDTSPTGGVCLFTSNLYPSTVVTLHTSLQAVAVRIHVHSLVTVCCVYLPPNDVVPQVDLNHLVSQLPAPFILLGDFNGHSPLWGHDVTNSRGRQIEQLISDHCLCLLNNDEKTYFHAPTRTFHSLDLAICSPTLLPMLNFEVANDLHNSDHFPLLVSHVNGAGTRFRPPTYHFHRADWDKFTRLAIITGTMVQNRAVDEAVFTVTEAIRNAADAAIPKTSNSPRTLCKPWWNASCQQAKRSKGGRGYVSSITSSTTSQQLWRKVKAANGLYRDFNIPILETSTALYSSPLDVANLIGKTFASVSSSDSYSPAFQATKNRLERTPINFRCRQPLPYNCDFDMFELKRALSSAHNTSPGPDGISYVLLRHLSEDSLVSLLYLFNRIWREQVYPTQWQEAIVIPILKPGKDPKNPLSYRPIALTSCLCKTLERMVNARLVYQVRLGGTLSAPFTQAEGVPQGSILSVTLFICHISSILSILSPSIQASLYVDDLQISCEGSDMRMIERQLQTAVNNILKWCDTNGHSISASKSCCVHFCRKRGIHPDPEIRIRDIQIPVVPDVRFLGVIFDRRLTFLPHILQLRKRCEKSLNLLKVLSNTSWGADRTSLLRVYQAIVLSRIDYGCVAYGSACNSTLKKLDPVHHMALRICSGAFRTSPVQSLYVNCHQLPLDLRRRKLSLAYYFKILSVPSHPLQNVYMSTSMKRFL